MFHITFYTSSAKKILSASIKLSRDCIRWDISCILSLLLKKNMLECVPIVACTVQWTLFLVSFSLESSKVESPLTSLLIRTTPYISTCLNFVNNQPCDVTTDKSHPLYKHLLELWDNQLCDVTTDKSHPLYKHLLELC